MGNHPGRVADGRNEKRKNVREAFQAFTTRLRSQRKGLFLKSNENATLGTQSSNVKRPSVRSAQLLPTETQEVRSDGLTLEGKRQQD
jgi:hypothetical protein